MAEDPIFIMDKKKIPYPAPRMKLPLEELEVGESFLLPGQEYRMRLSSMLCYVSKKTGFKFRSKQMEGGIRVWRVK